MKKGLQSITKNWPTTVISIGLIDGFIASFFITISWKVFYPVSMVSFKVRNQKDGGWRRLVAMLVEEPTQRYLFRVRLIRLFSPQK